MTDGRLSSLATLHIHKQKDAIDIDGVITDFPGLKGAHLARLRPWWPHCFTFCRKQSVPYRSSLFTENGLQKTQEMAFHFPDPKFEKFLGEHAPSRPPCLGRLGLANFSSPACTFKISCYTANYRHLIAYEINAQGWKKRLSLEGVGMVWGGVHFKICYCQEGGVQFSYVIILVGYSFDTPHFYTFLNPPSPHLRWDVINVQSLISRIWGNSLHAIRTCAVFTRLTALGAYYIFGPWEWALIKFSTFSASVICLFRNKTINSKTKREDVTKQGFCKILWRKLRLPGSLLLVPRAILWLLLVLIQCLGSARGKGVGVGAYSRLGAY